MRTDAAVIALRRGENVRTDAAVIALRRGENVRTDTAVARAEVGTDAVIPALAIRTGARDAAPSLATPAPLARPRTRAL